MNHTCIGQVLSASQIAQIREAALTHIERHGFNVQHRALLARARARGASVDETQGRVCLPRTLVAELMAQVPRHYTIGNILGDTWLIGGVEQCGTAIVTDPWIIDYETREPRHPCLEDLRRNTIVAEQLEPVVSISRMDYPVMDVPGPTSSLRALVIQQAYLRAARHVARGIRTDEPWLGTASLERVGPGGQFLDDELTLDLMRSDEFFRDDVFDLSGGHGASKSLLERAHQRVEQLVDGYESRVPGDIQEGLRRHFAELYRRVV